jgi:GTPase SAR1 family protein
MKGGASKIKYKIVFLGDQNVGKTALINRFINNTFDQSYNVPLSC